MVQNNNTKGRYKVYYSEAMQEDFGNNGARIADFYADEEKAMEMERLIAGQVRELGDVKELHAKYYTSILAFVHEITQREKLPLVIYLEHTSTDYGTFFIMEMIAETIYRMRKDNLGLKNDSFFKNDLSFCNNADALELTIDPNVMEAIAARVERKTKAAFYSMNLDKQEKFLSPWGLIVSPFDFHKILSKVFYCMNRERFGKMPGVSRRTVCLVCYDIAHRIHKEYTNGAKQSDND